MQNDDKKMFELDCNGGRNKVTKASYSPKASRRENAADDSTRKKAGIGTWIIIGCIILMVVAPALQPLMR